MESKATGRVSYAVLRRLLERAWDEKETQTLKALSSEMDAATVSLMEKETTFRSKAM